MFARLFSRFKRPLSSLSEQEVLALAISSEEDDGRIYQAYAQALNAKYPDSAKVFEDMAEVENTHKNMLIDMHRRRFGERIPLIRREHVNGFLTRRPDSRTTAKASGSRSSSDSPRSTRTLNSAVLARSSLSDSRSTPASRSLIFETCGSSRFSSRSFWVPMTLARS